MTISIHKLALQHQATRAHTQHHRRPFALNRNTAGFKPELKQLIYTLVCDKTEGACVYDMDGNAYIDLTMGFGSILFGHNHAPIREAITAQLQKSWSVGPITPLAGELAARITDLTGNERVAFFNSGTEAVMVALRLAKAVTRKTHIVYFKVSYHGTHDTLLSLKSDAQTQKALEIVPGVTQSVLNESYLLDYGRPESLEFIQKNHAHIAAVLVEPVQSRNPSLQPVEYLQELRRITEANDVALIFDEVITGFRADLGGCQALFGIRADIATYGKVIGGGLPIGIVAGKARFLDATDGGYWDYNDDSVPQVRSTFVAGTFCHHPLAMAAALKTLDILQADNGRLIQDLNQTTHAFCERLNGLFSQHRWPLSLSYFASLFRFNTPGKTNLIYYYLLLHHVYIWEGRNCFLSAAHTPEVLQELELRIMNSCLEMEEDGILKST